MSMFPLLAGICIEFYLVCVLVLMNVWASALLTSGLAAIFVGLWYVLPC